MDSRAVLQQAVCRGRLVVTSEAALWHRIPKALAFLNTEVLPIMMRDVDACARLASRSGATYLFH